MDYKEYLKSLQKSKLICDEETEKIPFDWSKFEIDNFDNDDKNVILIGYDIPIDIYVDINGIKLDYDEYDNEYLFEGLDRNAIKVVPFGEEGKAFIEKYDVSVTDDVYEAVYDIIKKDINAGSMESYITTEFYHSDWDKEDWDDYYEND